MIDGTPWRVTDQGADAVDAAVIVDNNDGEVLGVSEWARIDDGPLADIVRAVNAHDALVAALDKASQLAAVASDWNLDEVEIDGEMVGIYNLKSAFDAALALARGEV